MLASEYFAFDFMERKIDYILIELVTDRMEDQQKSQPTVKKKIHVWVLKYLPMICLYSLTEAQ